MPDSRSDSEMNYDFTVITPCYNAERYIAETMLSVLNNSVFTTGKATLEYIIQDGASVDGTLDIIRDISQNIDNKNISIKIYSEKDSGIYQALSRALTKVNGHICSYINAGDYYSFHAFEIVKQVFADNGIKWLTGLKVLYNDKSHVVHVSLPYRYRGSLIRKGAYGKLLPLIQQESTFWINSLNDFLDMDYLASLEFAGDYYLWREFSRHEDLKIVEAWLGGFKFHPGQISEARAEYLGELKMLSEKMTVFDYLLSLVDLVLWGTPSQVKKYCNPSGLYVYDHKEERYI